MAGIKFASWPGRGGDLNPFISHFVDSLENFGFEVVNLSMVPFDTPPDGSMDLPAGSAIVIHWPQFIYRDSFGYVAKIATLIRFATFLGRMKRNGIRVIWLCHDLKPHDWNEWQWQALWWPTLRAMLLLSDGIIALSPGTKALVAEHYSGWIRGRLDWAWHPKYEGVLASESTREEMRESLDLASSDSLVGFFGQIRLQKGVEDLMNAFSSIDEAGIHVVIAGSPLESALSVSEQVVSASERDHRIHAMIRKLEDDELRNLVSACDLCVFPYREYTHSGAMIYSLSAHRRILTPRTPFSASLAEILPDWVDLYEGPLTAQILQVSAMRKPPETPPDLSAFSAELLAKKVIKLTTEVH